MQVASQTKDPDQKMSPSIYAALVDSLFENPIPMLAGAVCAGAAGLMTAFKTGNHLLWPCALVIVVIGLLRAIEIGKYQRSKAALTPAQVVQWEWRYMLGGLVYAGSLGFWCLVVLVGSDDPVAHMLCTAVTVAYTAAGAGRTYGRPWIAQLQVALACGPMSLGLVLHGDSYYTGFALLLGLFFIGLRRISLSLHQVYVKALVATERVVSIAGQFDTALNNMPHGLCMFAADGRLAVVNHRFSEMMKLSDDVVQRGAGAPDIISACVSAGSVSAASAAIIRSEVENSQAREIVTTDPDVAKSRSLSWKFQPMAGGGTVVLVEDITERKDAEARISHLSRTGSISVTRWSGFWRSSTMPRNYRPCCLSTSTNSSRSTTRWVIPAATSCCAPSPTGCAKCCARKISWRGSAATNLWCFSKTSNPTRTPPVWRGELSIV
jgi:PAS domain-containing protein